MIADGEIIEWYRRVRAMVDQLGGRNEIEWSQSLTPVSDPETFATEVIWVICNSGMREQTARKIYERIMVQLRAGRSAGTVFGHKGKAGSIDYIWLCRAHMLDAYLAAKDKVEYLHGIAYIGNITKWHAAKNLGLDVAKPDRHLVRIATAIDESVEGLCARLARLSGDRVATVDLVLWRASNLGILHTRVLRTGQLPEIVTR